MKRLFRLDVLLIIVVLLVDSLAAAVGPETGNFARLFDIGSGRKMYLKCRGTGSPTVLFDSSCDSVVLSRRWQTLLHDRAGRLFC